MDRYELERCNVGDNIILHSRAFSRQNTPNHVGSLYHDGVRLPSVYTYMAPIPVSCFTSYGAGYHALGTGIT